MATEYEKILYNTNILNDSLNNVIETLETMDFHKPNYLKQNDTIDKVLEKVKNSGNKVIDSKVVKETNDKMNSLLRNVGDYAMVLSIPAIAFTLATGSTGYIFLVPPLLIGGALTKKFANRSSSIIKRSGAYVEKKTKAGKQAIKDKLQAKRERESLENADINAMANHESGVTSYEFASLTVDRITANIKKINDRVAFVSDKLKTEEFDCPKEEIMTLLQNDVLNTVVKLKIDLYNLSDLKQKTGFYPMEVNAVIMQGKYAIDSMCKAMHITNQMIDNKIYEIKEKDENAKFL